MNSGVGAAGRDRPQRLAQTYDLEDFDVRPTLAGPPAALVVAVKGDLDLSRVGKVRAAADLAIDARRPVVLDLSECQFIDANGLRLVLEIHDELASAAERLVVVTRQSAVTRAFTASQTDRMVRLCGTREEALEHLAGADPLA